MSSMPEYLVIFISLSLIRSPLQHNRFGGGFQAQETDEQDAADGEREWFTLPETIIRERGGCQGVYVGLFGECLDITPRLLKFLEARPPAAPGYIADEFGAFKRVSIGKPHRSIA